MKKILFLASAIVTLIQSPSLAQTPIKKDVFTKANSTVNKVNTVLAVFQPYLLKARQLFYDGKQLAGDVKNASKNTFGKKGTASSTANNGTTYSGQNNTNNDSAYNYSNQTGLSYTTNSGSNNNGSGSGNNTSNYTSSNNGTSQNNNNDLQNYLPNQSLPVNNAATINNDGTGNWGNQNNGVYGNCLDALTGTVMGMGDAAQTPSAIDLMFFAPADGQNTYVIMTPDFARNNSTAGYMTEHVSEQVQQWGDVNETEVALTKLTINQFNQIQNNSQIQSAVRNAQNYSGYYSSVGQKLDGQVLAVKAQMDNREVYTLIAIVKQIGTSGSNGYLKIKIKSSGIDNGNGQVNANAYLRQ
jgi:hypothetical protein